MLTSKEETKLGSLGQAARGNQLNMARGILFMVGLLTVAVNGFMFVNVRKGVDDEINKLVQQGLQVDQSAVASIVLENQVIFGVGASLGALFIILGAMVTQFPVACTVSGLVVYVIANLGFGIIDPATLTSGIVIKMLVAAGLYQGMKSAFAYKANEDATLGSLSPE